MSSSKPCCRPCYRLFGAGKSTCSIQNCATAIIFAVSRCSDVMIIDAVYNNTYRCSEVAVQRNLCIHVLDDAEELLHGGN